jgi:hypothetical protein
MNSRYAAYCIAHGASSPDEMMDQDRIAWPGGKMCGFILWMKEKWGDWYKAAPSRGRKPNPILTEADHDDFDKWLWENLPLPEKVNLPNPQVHRTCDR